VSSAVRGVCIAIPGVSAEVSTSDVEVYRATSVGDVEKLRPWWSIWQSHPASDIDYYLQSLNRIPGLSPHVIAVRRRGTLDCLLVGTLKKGLSALGPVGIPLPSGQELSFKPEGFLGNQSKQNAEVLVREVLRSLRQHRADIAQFCDLPKHSLLYEAARHIPGQISRDRCPVTRVHCRLFLPPTFEEYLGSLSAKERSNIRAHAKRLRSSFRGRIRVGRFRENAVEALIDEIEKIAAKSYQRVLGRGYTTGEAAVLRLDAQKGGLRGYVLYLENEPCAFLTAVFYKGTLHGRFIGYDPKYRRYSPGQYLLMRFIEDCYDDGGRQHVLAIDPGGGGQKYKRTFTNQETQECHLVIYAPTAKGIFLNLLRTLLLWSTRVTRAFLSKTGLTRQAWKMWKAWRRAFCATSVPPRETEAL
jgi:Acetyltransferase (GNAT) domain